MTIFVGVDPGGTWTGLVARRADQLLDAAVLRRETGEPDIRWIGRIMQEIETLVAGGGASPVVAIESVVAPTGRLGMISLEGLLGAAMVFGAVLGEYPEAVTVSPGGHGSAVLAAYPPGLRAGGETAGTGRRRHARSAWDIAGAAQFLVRVGAR